MPNSSFSTKLPTLQLAWDSVSIGNLKTCARLYYYAIICGWQSRTQSIHLTFGLLFHSALEWYDHQKFAGLSHEEALESTVRKMMCDTWDAKNNRPLEMDSVNKSRRNLVRTVIWYLDQFKEDPMQTVRLANGKPAVEYSFRFETDYRAVTAETFILCGHMDRVVEMDGWYFIVDRKTTSSTLTESYYDRYSPDNQFSLYAFAGKIIFSDKMQGIIVDAAQITVTFSRFQRHKIHRPDSVLTEWYKDLGYYLAQAQKYAQDNYWPCNDKSCGLYGGCAFRSICSKPPSIREQFLREGFKKRVWDPLEVRGEI